MWVDGIYTNVRHGDNRLCSLVVLGAMKEGYKEFRFASPKLAFGQLRLS